MSDSIPKINGIDPSSAGTNTPTERICSPTGQKMIDSTKEDTTVENVIKEEPRRIGNMPEPVLEEILKNLPLRDLKVAVLLSTTWRREGERPELWKGSLVRIHNRDDIKKLSIKRLKHLEYVDICPGDQWEDADWDAFFEATISLSRLKEIIGLAFQTLHSVQPEIMAKALSKLECVNLQSVYDTQITKDQAVELFKKICQKKHDQTDAAKSVDEEQDPLQKTGLKELRLSYKDLSAVEPVLMGKAVSALEKVNLEDSSMTAPQVQELFAQMVRGTQLKELHLSYNDLSAVEPELMGKAISGLEEVYLVDASLTALQVQQLFAQMNRGTKLKVLHLTCNNLSAVKPEMMGKAISGLEEVDLDDTSLTAPQVQQLFVQITQGSKLKELYLNDNDLSSVVPEVLARAVHRLGVLRLEDTNLTSEQYDRIVSGGDEQSKLKELWLWDPNRNENVNILDEYEDSDEDEDVSDYTDEDASDYVDEDVDEDVAENMGDFAD